MRSRHGAFLSIRGETRLCPPCKKEIPRPQFLDQLAVLLRFAFSVFQARWIVLKGPLSIATCIPKSNDDQETRSLR